MEDKEIQAMAKVNEALKELSEDECYRVMQWVANKYLKDTPSLKVAVRPTNDSSLIDSSVTDLKDEDEPDGGTFATFETLAELLAATRAEAPGERLLIAGYWLQVKENSTTWTTRSANNVLKPTGYGLDRTDNVSNALLKERPRKVIQIAQKSATGKGAGHKQLKLTDVGIAAVEAMISA